MIASRQDLANVAELAQESSPNPTNRDTKNGVKQAGWPCGQQIANPPQSDQAVRPGLGKADSEVSIHLEGGRA